MTTAASGRVRAIWLKRAKRGPMDAVGEALGVEGRGLEGNADQGGKRQVTLISAESWSRACGELEAEVDPRARRANLLLEGLDLATSRNRILRVGECRIRIRGETRPCERMNEGYPGLRRALEPEWRAGAYGEILAGGVIRIGDAAAWEEPGTTD